LPIAVASDANPGTSPLGSLLVALNMACVLFGLTPEEAFAGATVNAARALGVGAERGQVRAGFLADLVLWRVHPERLSYGINLHAPECVWFGGRPLSREPLACGGPGA
jgi:imidazolonepropionase